MWKELLWTNPSKKQQRNTSYSVILDYMYMLSLGHKYPFSWKQCTMFADVVFVGNRTCKWFWFDILWQKEHDTDSNETLWRVSTRMQQWGSALFCLALFCEIHSPNNRKKNLTTHCVSDRFRTCYIYNQQTNMLLVHSLHIM